MFAPQNAEPMALSAVVFMKFVDDGELSLTLIVVEEDADGKLFFRFMIFDILCCCACDAT